VIELVHFENFKSLGDVTLDLGRLTALVGTNGCGKSSVLQGIQLLSRTGVPGADDDPSHWNAFVHKRHPWLRFGKTFAGSRDPRRLASPGRPITLELAMVDSGGDALRLAVEVPAASEDNPAGNGLLFRVSLAGPEGPLQASVPAGKGEDPLAVLDDARVKRFASVVYLHLDANEMTRTSIPEDENPRMGSDGSGLASALAWMKGAAEDELAEITRDLARIVPGVKRIRTLRESVPRRRMDQVNIDGQPVWRPVDEKLLGDRFEIEFEQGPPVPADLLSEGTVLALGLLTKLREPARPRLVLLDDIDRGLHIEAQARLVKVLRDLLALDPELQIVCTTHSPYLLDLFDPAEVRVLALDAERRTRAQALTAHPEFSTWKFGTQTGELWAALGHAWVTAPAEPPP
jgi:energy-coupling factor transporter ATP-binding protein EcfA2